MMKVGIIGCGLIGQKRAKSLAGCELVACADKNLAIAQQLADKTQCKAFSDWQEIINNPAINIVVVATPHNLLAEITLAAINANKHVLVEKPAAKHAAELKSLVQAAEKNKVLVRVGFNHRYHRAFRQARKLIDENAIGELMYLRARYGHGGRIGYDKEWRAQPEISGGGELIDQGVHLIDLSRWFLGDFIDVQGLAHTYYWDMPVEDNGFLMLKTAKKQMAFLHASCTEWKNMFSMEIYGRNGKLAIDGLGGSYGVECLKFYKMLPEMGPPEITSWEYPMADDSWEVEFAEFLADIKQQRQPSPSLHDAIAALTIVAEVYKVSKQ
jgi:predicted dehydrogenase